MPGFPLKTTGDSKWVCVASFGQRGHNNCLDIIVQFIGRNYQTWTHLANLLAARWIKVYKEHITSMHLRRFHQFHSFASKRVAVGSSRSLSSPRVESAFAS